MRQGLGRLGFGAMALWFVFWTFAYVLQPHASENTPSPRPFALPTLLFLAAVAIMVVPWIARGFGRDASGRPR